jgi:hypothetical protein
MKRTLIALAATFAFAASLQAQALLSASPSIPVPDGAVSANEYQYNTELSGMSIGASLGTDGMVYLSIQAKTSGWVALGVGGRVMNGSRLFLAYDGGQKQVFSEQDGSGHSHGDVKDPVAVKWAVKLAGGVTTLELVLPASVAISNGNLNLLFAYSDTTSFAVHHKARGSIALAVSD